MNEELSAFGEMPRDYARENLGITPIFALEKTTGDNPEKSGDFIEVVTLRIAGDNLSQAVVPVDDVIRERFADEYSAWKKDGAAVDPRTSLKAWGVFNAKQIADLELHNVHTVEDIAALSDSNVHVLGVNAQRMRDRAIAFLSCGGDSLTLRQLQAENRSMKTEIAELRAIITAKRKVRA